MAVETVCFTVEGEFIADFARTRLIEGRFDAAIDMLQTLEGITLDQCISILRGEYTLTGDSNVGVDMIPDENSEEYLKQLHYIYDVIWNNNGRYMRPYAMVTSWGPDDMIPTPSNRNKNRYSHNSLYYADDRYNDVCEGKFNVPEEYIRGDILWREVSHFPHLVLEAPKDINEAIAKIRSLPERGYLGGRRRMNEIDEIFIGGTVDKDRPTPDPDEDQYATENDMRRLRQRILDQNGDDFVKIGDYKVPRKPFANWCLWRGDGAHLAPKWETVSPSGMKMIGDDPYHTDFMVGGGIPLDCYHNDDINSLIYNARQKLQKEMLGFEVAVLCGTGVAKQLKVVHPKPGEACKPDEVAVIPNAGPKYVAAATTAGAVITERGGQLAHLVTIGRESDAKIVRVENALELYPVGMTLDVDCSKGKVSVPYNRIDYKMRIGGMDIDVDALRDA